MADISRGPVSTLPGSAHALPERAMCDDHSDRPAVARVQGETDSFGCEYLDLCQECLKKIRDYANSAEVRSGPCEWCRNQATDLRYARDYDEGMGGPVYRVCGACIHRRNEEAREELVAYDREYDDGDDDSYEDERRERDIEIEAAARVEHRPVKPAPRITYRRRKKFVRPSP